jgi:hypothetical protein
MVSIAEQAAMSEEVAEVVAIDEELASLASLASPDRVAE